MLRLLLMLLSLFIFVATKAQENYQLYRTKGKLPAMSYSLGADRLGSAKMNFIDTNVLIKVIDSTDKSYIVQLSKNHTAYIDKAFTTIDTITQPKNFYLSNFWIAKGIVDSFDIVNIQLEEKLPYKIWMETNPNKIMLQLFGVKSNTNWINQLTNTKVIKNIYYNQTEDDVITATIELKGKYHWGFSASYNQSNALEIKIKRPPPKADLKNIVIAIDAGHGGSNEGTKNKKGNIVEKNYTLLFAKALEKILLKQGAKVIMTRTNDTTFDNKDRVLFLQQQSPHLLISLHLNSASNTDIKGVSTYYKYIGFKPLSVNILNRMLELSLNEFGNIGYFNFTLNAITDFPNCLVEIAFVSNAEDEEKIISPKFQQQVANKIYLGIKDFLSGIKEN
ncbi:MAG: N-acetylmuramoyl-L-alanine amidase [Chitinophagaceae bacterium]|nr:N-acetylmuramoyl-L-alanine amidase [Chitinophagaceae bacterium]MCW5905189.1 N-acetylmuramoyl-L-alanine amidase [Chitinophagaceae bacterium]